MSRDKRLRRVRGKTGKLMNASERDEQDRNYKRLAMGLTGTALLVVFIYGWRIADKHALRNAMSAVLVAVAPFALGGLAGFLFGIPKTLQGNGADDNGTSTGAASRRERRAHGWQTNTNLEQVSDWLTKILIGVGLTQLQVLPERVQDTADYVAESLGPNASSAIVASILISFAIAGFVIAYLLTKFDLGHAIDAQDGLTHLEKAVVQNPGDRNAVESLMLSSLYADPPDGFTRAIQSGQSFLAQEGHPQPEDGNVFAYLACAYGQKHAFHRDERAPATVLEESRQGVLRNVRAALERSPDWRPRLRQYANPPVGSLDDDLVSLREDPELRELLQMT